MSAKKASAPRTLPRTVRRVLFELLYPSPSDGVFDGLAPATCPVAVGELVEKTLCVPKLDDTDFDSVVIEMSSGEGCSMLPEDTRMLELDEFRDSDGE